MADGGGEEPRARKVSTFKKIAFRNSVFEDAILIEGYLKKFSHGVFKRWQERYFTVQGHYLKYYTDSNKIRKDLKGTIDLDDMQSCRLTGKSKGEFQLQLKGEGDALLKASSDDEAAKWVDILAAMVREEAATAEETAAAGAAGQVQGDIKDHMKTLTADDLEDSRAIETLTGGMKPVRVTIKSASNLPDVASKDGALEPLVIVTMVTEEGELGAEQLWMRLSPKQEGNNPTWGWSAVIPGVHKSCTLLFTVVDWTGDRTAFLGQGCWRMSDGACWDRAEALELPLGEFGEALAPKDGGGKEMEFAEREAAGAGELTVEIEPVNGGLCCAVKKRGETEHWKDRWIAITGSELLYYGEKSDGRPKHVVNLRLATEVTHPSSILELVDVATDEKVWHFRFESPDFGSAAFRAIRAAAGMQELVAGMDRGVSIAASGGFKENVKVVSGD
eukprot:g7584.t1